VTGELPQNKKDLIVLVADKNMEAAMRSVLTRHESLDVRQLSFDIYVHPYHDPGCRLESHSFLQPFSQNYLFAVVMFDRDGCGDEDSPINELESYVENLLSNHGWNNRSCTIVIDPELESWVWKNSPHVSNSIGWENRLDDLYLWLREHGFIRENETRPSHPKEALEAALRKVKKPRSSSIYSELGAKLSLKNCVDPSFLKLKSHLQSWFSS